MSLRVLAACLYVFGFSVWSWRNCFAGACGAVVLMAVVEHPDMPKSIGGIQGLNLWNILMLNVLVGWALQRRQQGWVFDLPRGTQLLFGMFFLVLIISFLRLFTEKLVMAESGFGYMFSEHFINCFKWLLPAAVLYESCNNRQRVTIAVLCVLSLYLLLAVQVVKWVPPRYAVSGDSLSARAARITLTEIGYHRVNLSMMLSGACWATLSTLVLFRKRSHKLAILVAAATCALAQALTGGRMGYVTWAVLGLFLCLIRWRKLLPLIPVAAIAIIILLPGVRERMMMGIARGSGPIVVRNDDYEMTSGRTLIWPYVIDKIKESPFLGYGREAMVSTGLRDWLLSELGEAFPHPHNMYLQLLLDNGIFGFLLVVPLFLVLLWRALILLRNREDPLVSVVGGIAFSLIAALLMAGMGSQTFYPREGSVGMWVAIALMLRVWVEHSRSRLTGESLFGEDEADSSIEIETSDESPQPA